MKITKREQVYHGMRVRGSIDGQKFEDGKISIDKGGEVLICQNVKNGLDADDKLGYAYSWRWIYFDELDENEYHLGTVDYVETIDEPTGLRSMKVGDVLMDDDDNEVIIIDVFPNSFVCEVKQHLGCSGVYSFNRAENNGWHLKEQEPKKVLTKKEVADKFGCDVDSLEIKE